MSKADLHLHLNGSFSDEFLALCARKNSKYQKDGVFSFELFEQAQDPEDTYQIYLDFKKKDQEIEAALADNSKNDSEKASFIIDLIWKKFPKIHRIVKTLEDIRLGTIDVVKTSEANYLEIRTTPKKKAGLYSEEEYISAFVAGLTESTKVLSKKGNPKQPYGVLSLDRTVHDAADAKRFIEYIKNDDSKRLVGLDISGNPDEARKLTGQELKETLRLALSESIPIAIHMGETNSVLEREDTDTILDFLEAWKSEQEVNDDKFYWGKVRLGHCIFLTDKQCARVRDLNLPVEVCPSCHVMMNWHKHNTAHPVSKIYSDGRNVVPGTDDFSLYRGNFIHERLALYGLFQKPDAAQKEMEKEYRFAVSQMAC